MNFVEDRRAEAGLREFRNLDPAPPWKMPDNPDLRWSRLVLQVGTRKTGGMKRVAVIYRDGTRRRFKGQRANRILRVVQNRRSDVGAEVRPTTVVS